MCQISQYKVRILNLTASYKNKNKQKRNTFEWKFNLSAAIHGHPTQQHISPFAFRDCRKKQHFFSLHEKAEDTLELKKKTQTEGQAGILALIKNVLYV